MADETPTSRYPIKQRIERLLRLFLHLQTSSRTATVPVLCRELAVSRRTLFRDMKMLRELGVNISYEGRSNTYHITDIKLKRTSATPQRRRD